MNEVQAMGFFIVSSVTVISILVCCGIVKLAMMYMEKKEKEKRELEEAAKMFEQRIALKPKHMGARIGMGVSGDVHFESVNNRPE